MNANDNQLAGLVDLCPDAQLIDEAGKKVVHLPNMCFEVDGQIVRQDLLFVPWPHSGYDTRLFFSSQICGKGKNWTQHSLLNRNWHAPSYRVDKLLGWRHQLLQHIKAVA